jgi:ABC-2 type transport system ATP-binding protein
LKAKLAGDRIVATASDPGSSATLASLAAALPGARDIVRTESTVDVRLDDAPAALPELVVAAHLAGVTLREVQAFQPTLDDVFLTLTGRSLRENDSKETTA